MVTRGRGLICNPATWKPVSTLTRSRDAMNEQRKAMAGGGFAWAAQGAAAGAAVAVAPVPIWIRARTPAIALSFSVQLRVPTVQWRTGGSSNEVSQAGRAHPAASGPAPSTSPTSATRLGRRKALFEKRKRISDYATENSWAYVSASSSVVSSRTEITVQASLASENLFKVSRWWTFFRSS